MNAHKQRGMVLLVSLILLLMLTLIAITASSRSTGVTTRTRFGPAFTFSVGSTRLTIRPP